MKQPNEDWVEAEPRVGDQSAPASRNTSSSCATSRTAPCRRSSRHNPHVAFRVDDLRPHIEGQEIIIAPFVVGDFVEVVFIRKYNTIFEYMHYLKDGWFGNDTKP